MTPIFNKNYNCLDLTLANVARFYGRDYEMMFLGSWGFDFSKDQSIPFEKRLKTSWRETEKYLSIFHGINIQKININTVLSPQKKILQLLDNDNIVAVKMDAYSCAWNLAYKKYHIPHFFLIMRRENNSLVCLDTYSSVKEEYIDVDINIDINSIFLFETTSLPEQNTVRCFIKWFIEKKLLKDHCIQKKLIKDFAGFLADIDYDFICSTYQDLWASPLCRNIREIGCSRKNFLNSLSYINMHYGFSWNEEITTQFATVVEEWSKLYRLFLKCVYSRDRGNIINQMNNLLVMIADQEYYIADKIKSSMRLY